MSDVSSEFDTGLRARALREEQAAHDALSTPYRKWVGGFVYAIVLVAFVTFMPKEFDGQSIRWMLAILLAAVIGLSYEVWVLRRRMEGLIKLVTPPPVGTAAAHFR
ncbi:hypothetical protein BH10PSE17_BH10PSE17_37690 [soil metagenome]